MISDESSSDSETGRFKCQSKPERQKNSSRNDDSRSGGRSRPSENDRFRREFDRKRESRDHHERRSRERHKYARHSPVRRRYSKEKSPRARDRDRPRHGADSRARSKPRNHRSASRDRGRSRSIKSPDHKKITKEESKVKPKVEVRQRIESKPKVEPKPHSPSPEKSSKFNRKCRESSSSPEYRGKRSLIRKPSPSETLKKKNDLPVTEAKVSSSESEEVVAGSYYKMAPTVIEKKKDEKPEESSEIDSSDDERLRAKLLNLEKELQRTKKKKHKKKHKRSSSVSKSHDRDRDPSTVEVTSTTDIDKEKPDIIVADKEPVEVTSTQKIQQKESSEEGEILSDDSEDLKIDPSDLRHKLKGTITKNDKQNVCGPALPPHLESKRTERSSSRDIEGPALPPHLQQKSRNIGPTIPDDVRQRLAEVDPKDMTFESSDEDIGIGPLPVGAEDKMTLAHQRLETRALDMKIKKLEGRSLHSSDKKSREQWMLELPEGKAKILGLEARSFRAKEGPDMSDRSQWTDTPEEKARKAAGLAKEEDAEVVLQREAKARYISSRDEQQEKAVKKHKKKHKRDESLLDIHQKKLKKKKKKEDKDEGKKERRPFSRDVDLQVNRFDEAQKKSVIKKAQELNTRFSRGEAKYL